jgi:VanZ family protein
LVKGKVNQEGNSLKFLKFWFPVLVYCCIIFGASSIPSVQFPSAFPNVDKLIHAMEYGFLAVLFSRAVRETSARASLPLVFAITLYFVVFYGITDEFHQSFVPGRSADLNDLLADTVGGAIAAVSYLFWKQKNNGNVLRG